MSAPNQPPPPGVAPGVAFHFDVSVDTIKIGQFSQCEGLTAEFEIEETKEGGNNAFVHRLPGRLKYQNLKLTRAIDTDTGMIADFFASFAAKRQPVNAHVVAYDSWQKKIGSWTFTGVWPVKYTGPQLNASTNGTANEVLELAHTGFTFTQAG